MRFATVSRRTFVAALAVAALAAPLASAWAAPFASNRITVKTEGTGPDVVLIPGLNSSPRAWASTVAALPGYRYHLVQVSGFAGQPVGDNKEGPFIAPVADEIARYIKEAGLKQPAVVGHSLGGTLGLTLAERHPELLSRLMVVDMFPYMGMLYAGPQATPEAVGQMADQVVAGLRAAGDQDRPKAAAATIASMVKTESMRPGAVEDVLKSDRELGMRVYREIIVTNTIPDLPKITVPVSVLYVLPAGAPVTPAQVDGFYGYAYKPVKQVSLTRIDDSAHFIMWDQPARFQKELKAFLDAK